MQMSDKHQLGEQEKIIEHNVQSSKDTTSRRSFLRKGFAVGGAGAIGAGLLANGLPLPAFAEEGRVSLTRGDVAILRFLAERYEHKSVIITTNLVFSEWERIFKNPMTTMAAIDRVIHHCVILDIMTVESYRAQQANHQHQRELEDVQSAVLISQ
jgi:hypothetical protein